MTLQKPTNNMNTTNNNFQQLKLKLSVSKDAKVGVNGYNYRTVEQITTEIKKSILANNLNLDIYASEESAGDGLRLIRAELIDLDLKKIELQRVKDIEEEIVKAGKFELLPVRINEEAYTQESKVYYTPSEPAKSSQTGKGIMSEPQWHGAEISYYTKYAYQMLLGLGEDDLDSYQEQLVELKPCTCKQEAKLVPQPSIHPTPAPVKFIEPEKLKIQPQQMHIVTESLPKVADVIKTAPLAINPLEDVSLDKPLPDLTSKTEYVRKTLGLDLNALIKQYGRDALKDMLNKANTESEVKALFNTLQ